MTPDERQRVLIVADGLRDALRFTSREMLDTGVRVSIAELREIAKEPADPIAAAVRAELQPLEDALIDAGHTLAQQVPSDTCDDLCMLPAPEGEP
jgi:hypothetical protein